VSVEVVELANEMEVIDKLILNQINELLSGAYIIELHAGDS